jgi:hypothetical protein
MAIKEKTWIAMLSCVADNFFHKVRYGIVGCCSSMVETVWILTSECWEDQLNI